MKALIPLALILASATSACVYIAADTATTTIDRKPPQAVTNKALTRESDASFATTEARLRAALDKRGLTLFTVVDHAEGANSVSLTLGQNKVFVFGNPKAGTLLMQTNPAVGMDLPLKAAIYEKDGTVMVRVSDIRNIAERNGIIEPPQVIANIEKALEGILNEVSSASR